MNDSNLLKLYKDKKILIISANGYIGSSLFEKLQTLKIDIYGTARYNKDKKYITCDISDSKLLIKIMKKIKPNVVINLSGYTNKEHSIESFEMALNINTIGLFNICKAVSKLKNFERLITIGTIDELTVDNKYSGKISPYAMSKYLSTRMGMYISESFDSPITIIRTGIVYGKKQHNSMFIPSLIDTLSNNKIFKMSSGEQKRDFLYIEDFLNAILLAGVSKNTLNKVINVGYGKSYKISKIALYIAKQLKKENLLKIGAISYRDNEIMGYKIDNKNHYANFAWKPTVDIFTGINNILQSLNNEK